VHNTGFSPPVVFTVNLPVTTPPATPPAAPSPPVAPSERIPVTAPAPTIIQPFPIVRIAGSENASGAHISLLTVQAPVGATVTVTCHGRGCPSKSQNVVATSGKSKRGAGMVLIAFRRFQRSLRAGAILEIRVSKPGRIGKYTRFVIRHGKLPTRVDMCLSPNGIKPTACPSS
jgi:hypothetical protein